MRIVLFLTFAFYLVQLVFTNNPPKEKSGKLLNGKKNVSKKLGDNKRDKNIKHRGNLNNFKKGQSKKGQIKIKPRFQHKHQVQKKPHIQNTKVRVNKNN